MPITFILLLIYTSAIVVAVVGIAKKIKILKIISALLFLVGIGITLLLIFGLGNM